MANRSQALMLRQFYRTRQRLQRRVPNELIDAAGMIETQLAKQPKYQDERFCNHQNTPLLQQTHIILREVREMGLIVDEHRDFRESMEQKRLAKGKGKKLKKFEDTPSGKKGYKGQRGEGVTWHRGLD